MNVPPPDEFSEELLAAYADGELDEHGRALVERWIAAHPEAMDIVRDQRELSATNAAFWDAAEPPEPTASAWAVVRRGIEAKLNPPVPVAGGRFGSKRVAAWVLGGLTIGGVAAAIGWVVFGPTAQPARIENSQPIEVVRQPKPAPEVEVAPEPRIGGDSPNPVTAFAVLPMPSDDDVVLDRVPAFRAGWLPIGQHPVPGMLTLASVDEVHLEEVNGGPKMTTAPGDAPMIYAAKPR